MRNHLALAILLALALPSAAVSTNEFLQPYLLPGERFSVEEFSENGGSYTLISISREPAFLLLAEDEGFSFVSAEGEIYDLLYLKALSETDVSELLDESLLLLQDFNESRLEGEGECKRQTGTDRFPCTDKDSCIVACRSVPNCEVALSYNIDSINEIQAWLVASDMLSATVANAESTHFEVLESFEAESLAGLMETEREARTLAQTIKQNALFECGPGGKCFCSYSLDESSLDQSLELLESLNSSLTYIEQLPSVAALMATSTEERTSMKGEGDMYALVLSDAEEGLDRLRAKTDASLIFVRDDGLLTGFNELQATLTTLNFAIQEKDYVEAEQIAMAFNSKLSDLLERASANVDDYYAYLDLRLNASNTLALLAGAELTPIRNARMLELEKRFNDTETSALLERTQLQEFRTEVIDIASSASILYAESETERLRHELERLEKKIQDLGLLAADYGQAPDLESISLELEDAKELLIQGDFQLAGQRVTHADTSLSEIEEELTAMAGMVDAASQALSEALAEIDAASEVQFMIIQPDLTAANKEFENARVILYTNPQETATRASHAVELAQEAVDSAHSYDQIAVMASIAGGIVLLVGVLYWLYKREEV